MRKLKLFLSLLMLIAFSVGNVWAAENDVHKFDDATAVQREQGLNNDATIQGITITNPSYPIKKVSVNCKYNKSSLPGVTISVTIGGKNFGDSYTFNEKTTKTVDFTGTTAASGDVVVSFVNNSGSGTGKGTFYVYYVELTEGAAAPAEPHTVSFSTGSGNPTVNAITETSGGAGITLPAGPTPACSADGWSFAGWAAAAVESEATTAPTLLSGTYYPTENCTLYAVYKRTEEGGGVAFARYEKVTSDPSDWSGKYLLAANTAGTTYYTFTGQNGSNNYGSSVEHKPGTTEKSEWEVVVAKTTNGYSLYHSNSSKYLGLTASSNSLYFNASYTAETYDWVLSSANGAQAYSYDTRYIECNTSSSYRVACYAGTQKRFYLYKRIEEAASTTYYLSAPSCCEKHAISIANNIENGSVSADLAEACEGTTVTLTFTHATNYHLSAWTLNGEAQDVNVNTFSMPAGAATVSATFDQDACEPLGTPSVTVSGKDYPYDAVQLAWTAIEHADAYKVYIYDNEDNELEHSDAFVGVEYTISETLDASTTYKYSVQAISNTPATFCPSVAATGSFVTEALPTAHLTLIALGEEQQASGDYSILTPFELPSTAAACSKTFRGWDANSDCATAPTYAKGAEFTFQNTTGVTLYAVYADETPGEATLTKMTSADALADGDKVVIVANGTQYGVYQETQSSSYVKNWELAASTPAISELGAKKIWNVTADNTNWKFGDATNGYLYTSGSNNLAVSTDNATSWSVTWNESENGFILKSTGGRYFACRTDLTGDNANLYRMSGTSIGTNGVYGMDIYKYATSASTYDNYSTTCVAAPTAEPASASIAVAAAGGEGTLGVSYENVNLAGVTVALFNNEACTEAFDGGWLTASIAGDDKHIAYNAQANTSYNDARTAYIKLTAPETNSAANPAVVVIPVEQAKKPAVFASLEDLVAAELASGTEVTVSFSNVMITEVYTTKAGYRYGLYLNVKDNGGVNDIELFYNKQENSEQVPETWVKNGYVSATNLVTTWTEYKGQWELAMQGANWSWENGDITYAAPKTVSSVVVSGEPGKKAYVDGEKFNPAGLTVTVNYTIGEPDVIDAADAEWVYETSDVMALNQTSINVKATYNTVTSENFYEVTDLMVNPISNKTIAQFIADEGGRCYLEGIVSGNINTTYGNFDLQDETGTIYVYGSDVFEDHGVAQGDKVKVIAEEYLLYKKQGNPDKDEALNVVFVSKVSAATIDIDDIDMTEGDELLLSDIVATITPDAAQSATINYEVTEGTAVTISEGKIIASTEGEATITASIAAGEGYLAGSTTFTVTVSAAPVPFVGDYFVKVDDNSDLTAGEYLIVYEDGNLAFNGGLEALDAASNTVAVTFENGKIQGKAEVLAATFTVKLAGGTIQSKSGYYIGRLGNSNGLNSSTEEAYTNTISIDENGDAVILASGGAYLRYNSTSGQERFRYFKSDSYTGQKAIQLYKKENAEPVYETVRENLTANRYYTVCLPKKVTAIKGASFWTLKSKSLDGATAYLEEETNNLPFVAGTPFIIQANAAQLEVVYEGAATEDAGTNGALHGTLVYMDAAALAAAGSDVYMLFSNELHPVGENNHLDANRAYVLLSELNAVSEAPQGAPGKRVRAMPMQPQVATGMDALNASDAPAKVLINGQLFIIRGEKMFDAKGQLVK